MKHEEKLLSLFDKKQKIMILSIFLIFFSLGIYAAIYSIFSGLFLMAISILPAGFLFYKNCIKRYSKVYRIEVNNNVPRFLVEYWLKKDVLALDQNYFWIEKNKYVPVIFDLGDKHTPVYPFNKPLPNVTAGHLERSLVQKASEVLMKPEKQGLAEAIKTGGLMILAGGGALVIISLFGRLTNVS